MSRRKHAYIRKTTHVVVIQTDGPKATDDDYDYIPYIVCTRYSREVRYVVGLLQRQWKALLLCCVGQKNRCRSRHDAETPTAPMLRSLPQLLLSTHSKTVRSLFYPLPQSVRTDPTLDAVDSLVAIGQLTLIGNRVTLKKYCTWYFWRVSGG